MVLWFLRDKSLRLRGRYHRFPIHGPRSNLLQSRWPTQTWPRNWKRARRSCKGQWQSSCESQRRSESAREKATRIESGQRTDGEREGPEREQPGCPCIEACAYTCSGLSKVTPCPTIFNAHVHHQCQPCNRASTYYIALRYDFQLHSLVGSKVAVFTNGHPRQLVTLLAKLSQGFDPLYDLHRRGFPFLAMSS